MKCLLHSGEIRRIHQIGKEMFGKKKKKKNKMTNKKKEKNCSHVRMSWRSWI